MQREKSTITIRLACLEDAERISTLCEQLGSIPNLQKAYRLEAWG